MICATLADLCLAFTEWDRRFREEPELFQSQAQHLLRGTPETYGEFCGPYFESIIREVQSPTQKVGGK